MTKTSQLYYIAIMIYNGGSVPCAKISIPRFVPLFWWQSHERHVSKKEIESGSSIWWQHAIWRARLNICRSSFHQIRNLSKIRKYLSQVSSEIAVHAFITSKMGYCNSFLCGCRKVQLQKLLIICLELCHLLPESLLRLVNLNTWSPASEHDGRVFSRINEIFFLFFDLLF